MFRQAIATSSRASSPAFRIRAAQPAVARWYSDAKESAEAPKEGEKPADDAESALKKQLEAKEKEAADWKDKCLRTIADFRNLQDRTQREVKQARDFALQKFSKDLIDSIDNLDRALSMTGDLQDLANLYEGLKMTDDILMSTLKKHGIERFDPEGEKFNPNEHDATFMAPQPEKEDNTVFHVQQKGFKLNGRVLRAAKVGVVKNA
ncbi:molecular chaperone [Colletotrichum tofieldiae]|nr:molecular chaperone [Colletotrichum tofieldiae]